MNPRHGLSEDELREFFRDEAARARSHSHMKVNLLKETLTAARRRRGRMAGMTVIAIVMSATVSLAVHRSLDVQAPEGAGAVRPTRPPMTASNVAISINGRRIGGGSASILARLGVGRSALMSVSMDDPANLSVSSATVLVFGPGVNDTSPASDALAEIGIPKGGTGTASFTLSHPGQYRVILRVSTYDKVGNDHQRIGSMSASPKPQGGRSLITVVLGTVIVE